MKQKMILRDLSYVLRIMRSLKRFLKFVECQRILYDFGFPVPTPPKKCCDGRDEGMRDIRHTGKGVFPEFLLPVLSGAFFQSHSLAGISILCLASRVRGSLQYVWVDFCIIFIISLTPLCLWTSVTSL